MNVFEVKLTRQAETQMREIAWYITVELHNLDAAENLIVFCCRNLPRCKEVQRKKNEACIFFHGSRIMRVEKYERNGRFSKVEDREVCR